MDYDKLDAAAAKLNDLRLSIAEHMGLARALIFSAERGLMADLDPYLDDDKLAPEQEFVLNKRNHLLESLAHLDLALQGYSPEA